MLLEWGIQHLSSRLVLPRSEAHWTNARTLSINWTSNKVVIPFCLVQVPPTNIMLRYIPKHFPHRGVDLLFIFMTSRVILVTLLFCISFVCALKVPSAQDKEVSFFVVSVVIMTHILSFSILVVHWPNNKKPQENGSRGPWHVLLWPL